MLLIVFFLCVTDVLMHTPGPLYCVASCSILLNCAQHMTDLHVQAELAVGMCVDVQQRVEKALGGLLDSQMSMHEVRLVAPNKRMLCLTFHIPPDIAFAGSPQAWETNTADKQQSKRQRTLS